MKNKFFLRHRLNKVGSFVEQSYLVYLNNDDAIHFPDRKSCYDYIRNYRSENVIFKIEIYRIETYSL